MFKRLLLATAVVFAIAGLACTGGGDEADVPRGEIVSAELLYTAPRLQIAAGIVVFGQPIEYAGSSVEVYRLVYKTIDAHGEPTQASGAVFVPVDAEAPLPLVSYQHGTILLDADAPSRGGAENIVGLGFAASGYVAVLPDLLGLGDSPGRHPFVQAAPSVTAVVDMLRATRLLVEEQDVELSGQVFLLGYSEGGYATMAAHRAIEAEYADEFTITAAAPMAGPYDLSGAMVGLLTSGEAYPEPYFLPYVILGYDDTYGTYDDPSQFFNPAWDYERLIALFDRAHADSEINAAMPAVPAEIVEPARLARFEDDSDDPLRRLLAANDVYDWTPEAPVRLYHCAGDRHVPFANSRTAYERFRAGGADVELIDPRPAAGHGECAVPSILLAKQWFDELVEARHDQK